MNTVAKIEFSCPSCSKAYSVAAHLAGKRAKCAACGNTFNVPAPVMVEPMDSLTGFDSLSFEFPDASFPDASFPDASFPDASFPDASFPDASFPDASFPDASFSDASFSDASVQDTSFPNTSGHSESTCPQCKSPLRSDVVLCVNCGFDKRTGKQRSAQSNSDAIDFPMPGQLRIVLVCVAFILFVTMLWIGGIDILHKFDAKKIPTFLQLMSIALALLIVAWRFNLRFQVQRTPGKSGHLAITRMIGPFQFSRRWDLSEFDSVWFVQKPWGMFRQMFFLMQTINSLGLILIVRKLMGEPEQVRYRAELRSPTRRKLVMYSGNEKVKDKVNSIVRLVRDAGKLPLKNDIEMLR